MTRPVFDTASAILCPSVAELAARARSTARYALAKAQRTRSAADRAEAGFRLRMQAFHTDRAALVLALSR